MSGFTINAFGLILALLFLPLPLMAAPGQAPREINRATRHEQTVRRPLTAVGPEAQSLLIPSKWFDFNSLPISESISPATFSQKLSSIARLGADRMVIVWQDSRAGAYKIFAQIVDSSGNLISGNSLLAERADGYDFIEPKAIPDGSGGVFLVWRDIASGRLYGSRYNASLVRIIGPFAITDTLAPGFAGPFDADAYPDGRLVVVWEQYTAANHIALRILNQSGIPLTGVIQVNSDMTDVSRWAPAVAVNKLGGIGVVWEDYRSGNPDIFMRLLNQDGTPAGADFGLVEALHDDSAQYLPDIGHSSSDGFAAAWLDRRTGRQRVYMQQVVPGVGLVGANQLISQSDSTAHDWDISLTVNTANNFVMAWASIGMDENIIIQRFGSGLAPQGENLVVNAGTESARWETSLGSGVSNKIFATWTDFRRGNPDIFMQLLSSDGLPLLSGDKLLNDDIQGAPSSEPEIATFDLSQHGIVFTDSRFDDGDIFLQRVGVAGDLLGTNLKINIDTLPARQSEPALAVSGGRIFVVWNDSRAVSGAVGQRIFGRAGSITGAMSPIDFSISDSTILSAKRNPAAAMSRNRTALVVWSDSRSGTAHIRGRLIADPGNYVGNEFLISTSGSDFDNDKVAVSRDSSDTFTVIWMARNSVGTPAAAMARYSAAGNFLNRFNFAGDVVGMAFSDFAATTNDSGDIYLAWIGDNGTRHLYLTVFNRNGTIKRATFEIPGVTSGTAQEPEIAVDNNRYLLISWVDSRSGKRIAYYQIFDPNFSLIGGNTPVSSAPVEYMSSPSAAGYRGRGWFTWVDPRTNGPNVYLTQFLYAPTSADDPGPELLPSYFDLAQNFPNPFNPATTISFAVPSRSHINVDIFDILGRKIRTIIDATYQAGRYEIIWDGRDAKGSECSSGVYFYRLTAGTFEATKRMILLK